MLFFDNCFCLFEMIGIDVVNGDNIVVFWKFFVYFIVIVFDEYLFVLVNVIFDYFNLWLLVGVFVFCVVWN